MAATVGNLRVELSVGVRKALEGMRRFNSSLEQSKQSMESVAASAKMVTVAMGAATAATAVTFAKFEASLTRAAVVASGGAKGFEQSFSAMSDSAIELAGRSQFTAKQVAEGMGFMAMAGNNAKQTIEAMPAAIMLASAAQQDLATATDTVTNIMAGFNIKADATGTTAQKLAEANNILVGTFANANVSLTELGESMKIAGPVASSLGVSIEDTAAALGILGNAGIKGTDAGTGLKRIFTSLAKDATPKVKKALNTLGISMETIRKDGIAGLITQLEKAKKALGDQAFTGTAFTAFGEIAGPKLAALVGQGGAAVEKLLGKIEKAKGENITEFLQEKQLATLSGQFDILASNAEAAAIKFGERLAPALKPVVEGLMNIFKALTALSDAQIDSLINLGKWIAGAAALTIAVTSLASVLTSITGIIAGVSAAAAAAGGILSTGLAAAFAAVAAPIAGVVIGLKAYEMATGKSISLSRAFSDALIDMTRDARGSELVMRQLGDAVLGVFHDFRSGDLSDAMAAKEVGAGIKGIQKEFWKAQQAAAPLLDEMREIEAVNIKASQEGWTNVHLKNEQRLTEIKSQLEDISKEERKAIAMIKRRVRLRKRDAEIAKEAAAAAKKNADEENKREQKRIRAAERRRKRQEEWLKKLKSMRKQAAKFLEGLGGEVSQQTARIEAGDMGGLLGNIQDFQNTVDKVAESFKLLGKQADLDGINQLTGLLEDRLMAQAKAFIESKRGTEDFAQTVEKVVKMINEQVPGLDLKTEDLVKENELKRAQDVIAAFRQQYEETGTMMGQAVKDSGEDFKSNVSDIWKNLDTSSLTSFLQDGLENVLQLVAGVSPTSDTAALENMAGAAMGAGGGIGSMLGAAIGSAVPGIGTAVGAAVGQIAEQAVGTVMAAVENAVYDLANGIQDAANAIAGIVPEQRVSGAVTRSVQPIADGLRDLGPAAAIVIPALAALAAAAAIFAPGIILATLALGPFIAAIGLFLSGLIATLSAFVAAILVIPAILLAAFTAFIGSLVALGGIFAFLANLAQETESFADMMSGFEAVADELIAALEPLFEVLGPRLVGLFSVVVGVLIPFAEALASSQVLINGTFAALKGLAIAFAAVAFSAALVQNAFIDIAQFFLNLPNAIGNGIINLVNAFIEGGALFLEAIASVADALGIGSADIRGAAADVRAGAMTAIPMPPELRQWSDSLEGMRVDLDEAGNSFRRVTELTDAQAGLLGEEAIARNENIASITAGLTNAPQGFKVALERFRAIQTGGAFNNDPFGQGENGTPPVVNNVGTILIQVQTEDEAASILEVIEQGNFDMAAAGSGKQFNPGFG
jgi:TP901 family phage tail tape measure protein